MTSEVAGGNLGLASSWSVGDDGWGAAMNVNLRLLDAIIMFTTGTPPDDTPPASPGIGDRYIIGAAPTGAWAGQANALTAWQMDETGVAGWKFYAPQQGWLANVIASPTSPLVQYVFQNGAWQVVPNVSNIAFDAGITGAIAGGVLTLSAEVAPVALAFVFPGAAATGAVVNLVLPFAVSIPANFAGTVSYAGTAPTAAVAITVNHVAAGTLSALGTATLTAGSQTAATLSTQAAAALAAGDVLQLVLPATADATLADLAVTVLVVRA